MPTVRRFSLHCTEDLKQALIDLELALLSGATQVTFLGQTVINMPVTQIRQTIDELTNALCERDALPDAKQIKRTKQVRIQTDSSGF